MSNYIFNNQIDVHSKIVYAGLKKFSNNEGICFPSRNTLVEVCKVSLSTVRKAINNLIDAKILDKQERYRQNGSQTSNIYSLTPFMTSGDYYFKVRNDIFDLQLSEKEIIVYMYLCSCSNKENECYPSLRQIAAACSISQTSVKIAMKELIERNLIIKSNQYRENGGRRNNLYKIVIEEDKNITINNVSVTNDEVITYEPCAEEDNQTEIIDNKEIDEIIIENNNEVEEINGSIQDNYVFDTEVPEQKLKVFIRDDIFDFKLSKQSILVYLYICTHSELKTKNFPSYEQIAGTCKISIAKVANAILELKTNELIVKAKQEIVTDTMVNIEPPPWSI
jgi:predicted transcriptional regulator